jgi:orotate phosphoribosyltransferase
MNINLIKHLIENRAVYYSEKPLTMKSGIVTHFDTDIRNAMGTVQKNKELFELVYLALPKEIREETQVFLGVPETGHFLSFYLNQIHAQNIGAEKVMDNLVREAPDARQGKTVLDIKEGIYTLLEDDIVSGSTVIHFMEQIPQGYIKYLVSVIERDSRVGESIGTRFGAKFQSLVNIREIHQYLSQNQPKNPLTKEIRDYVNEMN